MMATQCKGKNLKIYLHTLKSLGNLKFAGSSFTTTSGQMKILAPSYKCKVCSKFHCGFKNFKNLW